MMNVNIYKLKNPDTECTKVIVISFVKKEKTFINSNLKYDLTNLFLLDSKS